MTASDQGLTSHPISQNMTLEQWIGQNITLGLAVHDSFVFKSLDDPAHARTG